MAAAYIHGMQGNDPEHLRVAATLKHFYANNTEDGRCWKSSSVDPRNRYEYYIEPFRRAIEDGHAEAMMTAYNRINGIPGMLNHEVKDLMKAKFGLKHAVSDGGAMEVNAKLHHYFGSDAETIAASLKAGVDAMSDRPETVERAVREAYELKLITEKELDEALRNMFRTKLKLGIYDAQSTNPYDNVTEADLNSQYNQDICRQLSRESLVLLKNEGHLLPLSADCDADGIALIGPLADKWYQDWYGGIPPYRKTLRDGVEGVLGKKLKAADGQDRAVLRSGNKGIAVAEDGRLYLSDIPDTFEINDWGSGSFTFRCERTGKYMNSCIGKGNGDDHEGCPLAAEKDTTCDWFVMELFHIIGKGEAITLTDRFDNPVTLGEDGFLEASRHRDALEFMLEIKENGIEKACAEAKSKKTVLMALGCNSMINSKEEVDRSSIELPPAQQKLMEAVFDVNPNVVLVLFSNYPYAVNFAEEKIPAMIWSATGSQDMGTAAAECIFGISAPAGRLNMTWYKDTAQLPDINDYDIIRGKRTYRYFEGDVLYPFGHGLTYTDFTYSDMKVNISDNTDICVSLKVQNSGRTESDEVVQIYASAPPSRVKKPLRQLIGFRRIKSVEPGETRNVELRIPVKELRFFDVICGRLIVEAGSYVISAGASNSDLRLSCTADIPGEKTGMRDMTKRIPAEMYDDYENIYLKEGQFGFPAAASCDRKKKSLLVYRDCLVPDNADSIRFRMRSENGCILKVYLGGIMSGEWQGDTCTWKSHAGLQLNDDERQTVPEKLECEGSIFTDIVIRLGGLEALRGTNTVLELETAGDFEICWFRVC